MFNIFGSQSYLGVDIGTTSIKIAEISRGKQKPELKNYGVLESYGHLERINNAIQTSSLKIAENDTAELIRHLLRKGNFKTRDAVASIPPFAVFASLLQLPQMSKEETASTMAYQMRQYVPLPASEVTFDWFKVGEFQDSDGFVKQHIFLISVPNEIISKYKAIFKMAGLELKALEMESLSIIRSLSFGDPTPTLIIDIGARSTNIAVLDQGALKYNYQTDFAGSSLTQALASGLGINIKRAEAIKKSKGLLGAGGEYELSTLMVPFLDAILKEVVRARNNYEKSFNSKIERIILTGGGAKLLGIEKYCESQFNVPVVVGDSFSRIDYPGALEPLVRELGPSFSVAIGLGIREFVNN